MDRDRVTVQEAARHLGVSEQAIRKRVKRGTMESDKEEDGRVYVYLDSVVDDVQDEVPNPNKDALISEMHSRIESLERQLERAEERERENRRLLAAALERIPAIEPPRAEAESPPESREWPETAASVSYGTSPEAAEESLHHAPYDSPGTPKEAEESLHRRSWWQRWFGG